MPEYRYIKLAQDSCVVRLKSIMYFGRNEDVVTLFRKHQVQQMALVVNGFCNGLSKVENVYDVVQFPGVAVLKIFKIKVKVTHQKCFAGQTVRVFKEVEKLIEKLGL